MKIAYLFSNYTSIERIFFTFFSMLIYSIRNIVYIFYQIFQIEIKLSLHNKNINSLLILISHLLTGTDSLKRSNCVFQAIGSRRPWKRPRALLVKRRDVIRFDG